MVRIGSIFKIKPELKDEYRKTHDKIWPEMAKAIKDVGIRNYSIFFREDGTLFSYREVDDYEKAMKELAKKDVNVRWQKHIEKYFVKGDKSILGPEIEILEEVFHMD